MSDLDKPSPQDLAAAYALGALDPAEARAFERELASSAELRREVATYREVNALLAPGAPPAVPAADLRDRVMARVAREKVVALPLPRTGRSAWPAWIGLAASLVAAVGLGLRARDLDRQLSERNAAIDSVKQTLAERESKLAEREATLNTILEPQVELHLLKSTGVAAPGIQLFVNPSRHIAIAHAFRLKPAATGRVYQLWFIPKNGKPIPSVTFNSEYSGHALVQRIPIPTGMELTAAAITDEPEGGSPQPTTTPFLVGSLGA